MKKLLALWAIISILSFGITNPIFAQGGDDGQTTEMAEGGESTDMEAAEEAPVEKPAITAPPADAPSTEAEVEEERSFHQVVKEKFIKGGPFFMSFVLICLILGLAVCIERIIYLTMATSNTDKLVNDIETALGSGGVDAAKEVCRNTSGPVASIFYQGLDRFNPAKEDGDIDMVEKSVVSYGSVQMGLLEKGLSWVSLFIALAPMLGFFGTVIGMIGAFDAIARANNISPAIVADGIGMALITTVAGLLVAMILQVFYNFIVAKIDSLVNEMEDASISMVDILIKHQLTNK